MAVLQQLSQRVSIVGWGSVSPLGCDAGSTWDGVLAERSGIRALSATWSDDLPVRMGKVFSRGHGLFSSSVFIRSDRAGIFVLGDSERSDSVQSVRMCFMIRSR